MEDFPPNSHSSKLEQTEKTDSSVGGDKKIEKVITGEAARRKKPLSKRFMETFVGGDSKSVWGYVFFDVIVPAVKDMAADAVSQSIERLLFGETRSTSRRTGQRPSGSNGYVSYNRFSSQASAGRREEPRTMSRQGRATFNFDEVIVPTRGEAEMVIDRLFDLVSRYEQATVSDLYELVGVSGTFTDEKWGWTDIRGAGVTRVSNGYLLDLPRPEPLRN